MSREDLLNRHSTILLIQWTSAAVLLVSAIWFVVTTFHWPLIGDAALMHYIVFLTEHGLVPYREIADMNLPGAYLPDWIVMHTLGANALAWRIYDLLLLLLAGLAFCKIVRPASWFAGGWAAVLFAVVHGRDGIYQTGQRDLTVAVLLLIGVAFLPTGPSRRIVWTFFFFGLCTGAAALIKPTALPFLLLAAPLLWHSFRSLKKISPQALSLVLGAILPSLIALAWLIDRGALTSFVHIEATLTPFHANLGRHHLGAMLQHSLSPIMPLVALWLLLLLLSRMDRSVQDKVLDRTSSHLFAVQRQMLLFGAALGMLAYFLQGKDFQYHRYSLIAFLLAVIGMDLDVLMHRKNIVGWMSAAVFLVSSLFIGGTSAIVAGGYNWKGQEFRNTLEADLMRIAAELGATTLSGKVQCLDSVAGCISTLYDMRWIQSSGFLYDEFLFHPAGVAATDETRVRFAQAMQANPPAVLVVTEPLFPDGPNHYEKLLRWPYFTRWMNDQYIMEIDRPAMRSVRNGGAAFQPPGYRIYVERSLLQLPIRSLSR